MMNKQGKANEQIPRKQEGEKIFGAPPKQVKRDEKAVNNRQSGIPAKKSSKADKTSALVVCTNQNAPTAYDKQNFKADRTNKSNERYQNRDIDDDEDFVITTDNVKPLQTPDSNQKRFQPKGSKIGASPKINADALEGDDVEEVEVITYNKGKKGSNASAKKFTTRRSSTNTQNSIQLEQEMDEEEDTDDARSASTAHSVRINKNEDDDESQHSHRHHRRHSRSNRSHHHRRETSGNESYVDDQNVDQLAQDRALSAEQNQSEEENTDEGEQDKPKSILKKNSGASTPIKDENKLASDEQGKFTLFDGILDQLNNCSDSAMQKLSQWQRQLLRFLSPLEEQQLQHWYLLTTAYLEQQGITHDEKSLAFREELDAIVEVVMEKHGFTTLQGVLHRMRVFITGPRKSGKSTLLSLTAQRALIELAAGTEWKHTFVFAYDFATNSHTVTDNAELYKTFVRATFAGLSAQRPLLSEHAAALSKAFCDVVDGNPLLPKSFTASNDFRLLVPQISSILSFLQECWRDEDKSAFIANAVAFPQQISAVFGFDRLLVIADHFDAFATEMSPQELYVIGNVKILLNTSNFIVASQSQEKAAEIAKPADIDDDDLTQSLCKLSTLDVVNEDPFDGVEFSLTIENSAKRVQINFPLFGGCPAFLVMWNELNDLAAKHEAASNGEDTEDDPEEIQILLVNKATEIFSALTEGQSDIVVTAVNKINKK
ncbi:hypothetical protein TVAG_344010 [Trichomonas vaginalis G3]|uniref:Uncharacterized protein n=1 Tax=Trichomonas vaginalis (strain ATCC PRA-98 / G3) TaxID=412133 RepID=A2E7M2_TRIV3|nr:hypothetical protein TVAGG3_0598090 [Trichomonas vaginalis G3]EAY11307.1 hypothetical protein TVAG_344010 [Trichomonas vaginalis G3]KAI5523743.1 hypothetical protein TVAGG3_0598090 [Trichomonas vaginalis G3]|eukprot:XP_001323530.1 hypothetical protein [Trichomonas vaginalis G3]